MNTIDVNPININKQQQKKKDSRSQGNSTTFDRAGKMVEDFIRYTKKK